MTKLTEANVNLSISDLNSSDMQTLSQILSLAGQAEQAGSMMGGMDPMGDGMMGGMPGAGLEEEGPLAMAGPDEDYGMDPLAGGDDLGMDDPMADPMADPMGGDDLGMGDELGMEEPTTLGDEMDGELDGLGLEDDMGMEEEPMDDMDMMEGLDRIAQLSGIFESKDEEEELEEACGEDHLEEEEEVIEECDGGTQSINKANSDEQLGEEEEIDEAVVALPPQELDPAGVDWQNSPEANGSDFPNLDGDPNVPPQDPAFMDGGDPEVCPQDPAFMGGGDPTVVQQDPNFMSPDRMRELMDSLEQDAIDARDATPIEEEPMGFDEFNAILDEMGLNEAEDAEEDEEEQLDENAEGMFNFDLDEDAVAEMDSPGIGDNREFGPYSNEQACMIDARKEIPGAMRDREVKLMHRPQGWFWSKLNEDATLSRPNVEEVCTKAIENKEPVLESEETVDDIHTQLNEQFEKFMRGE